MIGTDQHRAGVLIDANILLVLLFGEVDPDLIARSSRTRAYTAEDYQLALRFIAPFRRRITTPHVLAEVSNLVDFAGELKAKCLRTLHQLVELERLEELTPSFLIVGRVPCFSRLGLTDAALMHLAREQVVVLTDDAPLAAELQSRKLVAVNFNHLRF